MAGMRYWMKPQNRSITVGFQAAPDSFCFPSYDVFMFNKGLFTYYVFIRGPEGTEAGRIPSLIICKCAPKAKRPSWAYQQKTTVMKAVFRTGSTRIEYCF